MSRRCEPASNSLRSGQQCTCTSTTSVQAVSDGLAERIAECVKSVLEEAGFPVTYVRPADLKRYIGLEPIAKGAGWKPIPERRGALDCALEQLGWATHAPTAHVQQLLAIYIYFGLLWRPSISAPHCVYKWIEADDGCCREPRRLWPSVYFELDLMRAYLGFLQCDLGWTASPIVLIKDAAGASRQTPT